MFILKLLASGCVLVAVGLFSSAGAWAQSDDTPAPQACCMPDGTCTMVYADGCLALGGQPQGALSVCVGDWDGDRVDETCAAKWIQPPDVNRTGIDVHDLVPVALADDFLCTETNAITRIILWGSWLNDMYPYDPANLNVTLMLRADIPDPDGTGPAYSRPGKALWSRSYRPYSFRVEAYAKEIEEGYWDPRDDASYTFPGDTVCWIYIFDIPVAEAFCQKGTDSAPVVYWLDVQASVPPYPGREVHFGWKTTTRHWNDDAAWQLRDPSGFSSNWGELRYPPGHPLAGRSMDLAFALEAQPCVGACCYDTGCRLTTEGDCYLPPYWSIWMGPGTNCDDLDGDGVADICEPVVHQACCHVDATCTMSTIKDCEAAGGTPMGVGTTCETVDCRAACCYRDGSFCVHVSRPECEGLYGGIWHGYNTNCDDLDGDSVADECELAADPSLACCFSDGSCEMLTVETCVDKGGKPQGPGSECVGDWDGDKIDDACDAKWVQPPDLDMTGIDIDDTLPVALADDFLCTETNAITRIVVWGSWLRDHYPTDPANVTFKLMLRADVPDPDGDGPAYSIPGQVLWKRVYQPYTYRATLFRSHIQEGFWDPQDPTGYLFPGDSMCWMYVFDVPVKEAFCQRGSPDRPIVYWLDVQASIAAVPSPYPLVFGWKTTTKHWNDDAVWQYRSGGIETPFHELRYPEGHSWVKQSLDLAFMLETQPCVMTPDDPVEPGAE